MIYRNPANMFEAQTNGKTAQENYDTALKEIKNNMLLEREIRRIVREELSKYGNNISESAYKGVERALNGLKIDFVGFSK